MMAGPSFGSAVAVSQGAGELELGMSDFLGGIFGAWHCCAGAMHHGGATCRGGGRRTAVGDAPQWATHRVAPTIWSGGVFGGVAPLRRGDAPRGGAMHRGGRRTALGGRRAASPLRYDMVGRDFWGVALLRRDDASRGATRRGGGRRTASPLHGNVGVAWGRSTATPLHSHNPPFTINRPVLDHS